MFYPPLRVPLRYPFLQIVVPAGAVARRAGDATISPLWPEEVEVGSEGKDTVEIALHFEAST